MAPLARVRVPSYRLHATGQATVRIAGHDWYLGQYGSPESHKRYHALVGAWIDAGRPRPWHGIEHEHTACDSVGAAAAPRRLTVGELVLRYVDHVDAYYRKNGRPTSEVAAVHKALAFLHPSEKPGAADEFGPRALKRVRDLIIEKNLSRPTVNGYVGRIKRMFRWAVAEELVGPSAWDALRAVEGLKRGRTAAREPPPILPVSNEDIARALPFAPEPVAAMIRLQHLTGMRPGEVVQMRRVDINTNGDVWMYTPQSHKTEHYGRAREIALGPQAQAILAPFFDRCGAFLFSPTVAESARNEKKRASRRTPRWPSHCRATAKKRRARRHPIRDHYDVGTYRQAVQRACDRAGIRPWNPNQLRHAAATNFRAHFGLEATRAMLGHSSAITSEIYAERDREQAVRAMKQIG